MLLSTPTRLARAVLVVWAVGCAPSPAPSPGPTPQLGGTVDVLDRGGSSPDIQVQLGPVPMKPVSYEERGGVREGCKAVLYQPADLDLKAVDEGEVAVTGLGAPVPCRWAEGYRCGPGAPMAADAAVSVAISPLPAGRFRFAPLPPVAPPAPFTLDTASQALLARFPVDGQPITLSCTGAGGSCADAADTTVQSWLHVVTTDADRADAAPDALPAPRALQAVVDCIQSGTGELKVPARAMAYIMNAAPTRIRASYARVRTSAGANPDGEAPVVLRVGRAVTGIRAP